MLKMIIVDDERKIRESMKNCIDWEELDIQVIGLCKNGLEAYDMIIDESPDIVLTDIKMPALSGLELISRITQIGQHVEFIILSGYGEYAYTKEAMKYGIKHYLLKPCNEEELVSVVKDAVKSSYEWKEKQIQSQNAIYAAVDQLKEKIVSGCQEEELQQAFVKLITQVEEPGLLRTVLTSIFLHMVQGKQGSKTSYRVLEYLAGISATQDIGEIRASAADTFKALLSKKNTITTGKDFVDQTVQYVHEHLSNPELSLKLIAETQLFMNVDYLSKQFSKYVGCKFSAFLAQARIEEAKRLLSSNPNITVQEVAAAVGCGNNPQYFSLLFKKHLGVTATDYVKQMRNR